MVHIVCDGMLGAGCLPGVDDLALPVCVQDDVTVSAVELTVGVSVHRNSSAALHPPDLKGD